MSARPLHSGNCQRIWLRTYCCLVDPRARTKLVRALRDHAVVEWFDTFAELRCAIARDGCGVPVVVIGVTDACGESMHAFVHEARESMAGTSIVVWYDTALAASSDSLYTLADDGVHDILITGVNDDPHTARTIIFGATLGGAADVVMHTLAPVVPADLMAFVELVVRRPRELHRVTDVASALRLSRQTIARWCRDARFTSPEELLVWGRILLAAALLERTQQTFESVATGLRYGSPTALRNRIKEYTGLTSNQVRGGGVDAVMKVFVQRVEEARGERTSIAPESSPTRSLQIA